MKDDTLKVRVNEKQSKEIFDKESQKPRKIQSLLWADRIELKLQQPSFMGQVKGAINFPCQNGSLKTKS